MEQTISRSVRIYSNSVSSRHVFRGMPENELPPDNSYKVGISTIEEDAELGEIQLCNQAVGFATRAEAEFFLDEIARDASPEIWPEEGRFYAPSLYWKGETTVSSDDEMRQFFQPLPIPANAISQEKLI